METSKIIAIIVKIVLFLALLCTKKNVYGQQISLQQCVSKAIEDHPDVKASYLQTGLSKTGIDQAKSNFLPQIGASVFQSGNFGRSIDRCEFSQTVAVDSYEKKAGYFELQFKGKKYLLAPEPTTTGAVRLEDKKAGIVWIHIANKSMLMTAKVGQRLVDECVHPTQKT